MNLLELIRLNNRLADTTVEDLQQHAQARFEFIMHHSDVPAANVDFEFRQRLTEKHQNLQQLFASIEQELLDTKHQVQQLIDQQGNLQLEHNYNEYAKRLETQYAQKLDYLGLHQNQPQHLNTEIESCLRQRAMLHCNWKHPAMIIHPMATNFTQDMVSADPLYLVDESRFLLEPTVSQFSPQYQQRLRIYTIEESINSDILNQLPDQQFGFCLVYNYLDYRPLRLVKQYLEEIYQKLLPGGIVALTFNDCDDYRAMESVEQGFGGYTPGHLIRACAAQLGFEEIYCCDDLAPCIWIEFKKPGELHSLRGGQALARVLAKVQPDSAIEPLDRQAILNSLRQQVMALNIYNTELVLHGFSETKLKEILVTQSKKN